MFDTMKKMTDKSHRLRIREFINFKTLDERLADSDMITLEFLGYNDEWHRARFVVTERLPDGKVSHVLWLVENIDAEKRERDAIAMEANSLSAQITSVANIYMAMFDIDLKSDTFRTIKCDNEIVRTLIDDNTEEAQILMFDVLERITDETSMEDVIRFINFGTLEERLRNTEAVTLEFLTITKKWVRSRFIASQRTYTGELSHVMWLTEDIDDEKRERDKLIDASERAIAASEAKSSFLSNMSHEIRTPINAVLGMNEMILRECDDSNILAYSESIRTAGNTLLGLINDILDFSKIEAGKMEIIPVDYDISSVINDLVNMIQTRADDKGLVLVLDISKDVPKLLRGDEVRLKQVITNILTNAVKYTEKGSVTFCMSYSRIAGVPDSVMLEVAVKDTGIGIKPEDMKKLFSEFERIDEERNRNVEGTGLGMNITQRLLQMMGSQLKVESVYGLGSKFSFSLKQRVVKWEALGDYEAAYKASLKEHKKYREKFTAPDAQVLVVDDTPMNLMVFKSLLKQTGVKIDTAASGDEGLTLMAGKKYDIIFLDHMMPEKDGIETLHELRAKADDPNRGTPAICLTANAISGAREQYLSEGFDDYLTKPIDSAKLEETLLEYIPRYKIHGSANDTDGDGDTASDNEPELPGFLEDIYEINTDSGITNCGSVDGYITALKTYAEMINDHADETEKYWNDGDIANATIKIHAMKSTSRIIGAVEIGEFAQSLENAGKAGDADTLGAHIGELLRRCRALGEQLSPLLDKQEQAEDESLPFISEEELHEAYALLKEATEAFQFDNVGEIAESLKGYRIPDTEKERVAAVIKAVGDLEYDKLPEILS
ncbi:MAG: response regulator [Ruminiclostridium sp.]|nr:response regulator [Ruminiclostridium sp.]